MNEPDHIADEVATDRASMRLGLLVVGLLVGIVALVVITLSFSTRNTPYSIDGHKAVYSHNLPSGK